MKIQTFWKMRKYESYFLTATKANYIRGLMDRQIEELIGYGDEIGIHYKNNHCPSCLLAFIKKLAKPYFEQKQKMNKGKEKSNEKKIRANEA